MKVPPLHLGMRNSLMIIGGVNKLQPEDIGILIYPKPQFLNFLMWTDEKRGKAGAFAE
jgi:hypothetical protein